MHLSFPSAKPSSCVKPFLLWCSYSSLALHPLKGRCCRDSLLLVTGADVLVSVHESWTLRPTFVWIIWPPRVDSWSVRVPLALCEPSIWPQQEWVDRPQNSYVGHNCHSLLWQKRLSCRLRQWKHFKKGWSWRSEENRGWSWEGLHQRRKLSFATDAAKHSNTNNNRDQRPEVKCRIGELQVYFRVFFRKLVHLVWGQITMVTYAERLTCSGGG